jgi:hypothetical protein
MGIGTSLLAISDLLDPRIAYWSVLMVSGKVWSEHSLVGTLKKGVRGVRKLDWGEDMVTTGDVYRVKEIRLRPPMEARMPMAVLEVGDGQEPFQFKVNTLDMIGANGITLEYIVVGRTVDKGSAESEDKIKCECFIWDYKPLPVAPNLIAYKSTIGKFGGWRDTITPLGALNKEVQGFRL